MYIFRYIYICIEKVITSSTGKDSKKYFVYSELQQEKMRPLAFKGVTINEFIAEEYCFTLIIAFLLITLIKKFHDENRNIYSYMHI